MCSGVHERVTSAPPPGSDCRSASSVFGQRTVIRAPSLELDDELGRGAEVDRADDDAVDALGVAAGRGPVSPFGVT